MVRSSFNSFYEQRPLPYPEPERLVGVWNTAPGYDMERLEHSDATYLLYRKENRVLEDLGIYWDGSVTLTGGQSANYYIENGTAPDSILASRNLPNGGGTQTRPLCPHPTVAKYTGNGSTNDAANFVCSQ